MASGLALALYAVALAAGAYAVWRRPVLALYAFLIGLALHNLTLALLYGAGVRGGALDAIQAWKEILLAVAVLSVALAAGRARRLPFRPAAVDALALAFAVLACLYAVLPQRLLGGAAGAEAIAYGLRHALVPVVAYFLGRSLLHGAEELRRLGWTLVGAAAALAAVGLVDIYAVPVEWWRDSGAVGWFTNELGFDDYRGPGGLPDNFAFNSDEGLFRRLVSTFISPLATAFVFVVALLLGSSPGPLQRRPFLLVPLLGVAGVGLLFTLSRSSLLALAGGFVVLALARRRAWPLAAAGATLAAGIAFALTFPSFAPETHFFPEDIPDQVARAQREGGLPENTFVSGDESSLRSHLTSLRDGLERVVDHPEGYGLGNAGAVAVRFDEKVLAGESNFTENGVETGLARHALFVAWQLALLRGLVRTARSAEGETARWAAGGLAAALAAVLALAVQTDAYGVPWLAYNLWWLGGALLVPAAARVSTPAKAPVRPRLERA